MLGLAGGVQFESQTWQADFFLTPQLLSQVKFKKLILKKTKRGGNAYLSRFYLKNLHHLFANYNIFFAM